MKIKFLKNIFLISGAFSLSTFLISCNTKKSQNSNDVPNNNNKEVKINEFKLEINNDSLKAYITGNNLNNLDSYDFKIVNPKNEEITDFYKDTAASSNDSLILINNLLMQLWQMVQIVVASTNHQCECNKFHEIMNLMKEVFLDISLS